MADDSVPTSFDDHSAVASRILPVLENFADAFSERTIPGHLEYAIRDGRYLKASRIGQKPERFVEDHLIWPALEALNYDILPQPFGYPKFTKKYPDFAIQNFDCNVDCSVIGEVKTLNKMEYAEDNIVDYLKSDLGEPTVGFATDGVSWKVYARPEKEAEPEELIDVDLSEAFTRMIRRHKEKESYEPHQTRKLIEQVERLHRQAVEDRVDRFFAAVEN